MLQYIQDIIIPFVDETRQNIGADEKQPALAIFDHFKGQMTGRVIQNLKTITYILYSYQQITQDCFNRWMFLLTKLSSLTLDQNFPNGILINLQKNSKDCEECVDLFTARMKPIGARWLVNLYEHLENSPDIIVNGFRHAGIHQALYLLTGVNYSESSSEDSASDIEENEVDNAHPSLLVSDVYSNNEPESVIPLSSSDNYQ